LNAHRQKSDQNPKRLSDRKRLAFLVITIAMPFLFFLLLEGSLRLLHYGPNLSLFVTENIGGRTFHIMNYELRGRYFSRIQFTPNSSQDYFLVPKPAGTFRIFCLGGSTTVGFPYGFIGSFSTFLRDRLNILFPERSIEVINLGMTATNSFTVVDIARELVDYQPDMFIAYDGHNEFYGALGIASNESLGSSRFLTEAYLRLIHFRTFLLLRDVVSKVAGVFTTPPGADLSGTMMERLSRGQYIPYRSKTYLKALEVFKANLRELKTICNEHSIPLLLSSQVSNLRTQAPFISDESLLDTPDKRLAFNSAYNRGLAHWLNGGFDSALTEFRLALSHDSLHAETRYRIARTLDTLGRKEEARTEYVKARDFDNLRFRTSSDFNEAIRSTADSNRVVFVDMERKFKANSPDSIVGSKLILEHLHPNLRGYFLIAKEYAETMREHQFLASAEDWNSRDTLTDSEIWNARSITELDERIGKRRIEFLTSGWPFVPEQKQVRYSDPDDTLGTIVDHLVQGRSTWEEAHVSAAQYYESRGELQNAEKQYLAIINQIPLNVSPYLVLGQLYLRMGRKDDSRAVLLASLKIERTTFANRSLGTLLVDGGKLDSAITFLEQAFALSQSKKEQAENGYLLAFAFYRSGKTQQAATQLQRVLSIDSEFKPAQQLLRRLESRE
jgi:tetratricopeptide (TPR) repeat protein